jgi:hypothetical protein
MSFMMIKKENRSLCIVQKPHANHNKIINDIPVSGQEFFEGAINGVIRRKWD